MGNAEVSAELKLTYSQIDGTQKHSPLVYIRILEAEDMKQKVSKPLRCCEDSNWKAYFTLF